MVNCWVEVMTAFPLQRDRGGGAARNRKFFAACVFRAILLFGGGAAALGASPRRVERPFLSDALERDYRGRGKPGFSGNRAPGAGSTLPDLLGPALHFRAQPRVFRARCAGPEAELFRLSDCKENLHAGRLTKTQVPID